MMTDPAVKIGLALCVLLSGICAAGLFRHERPAAAPDPLAIHCPSPTKTAMAPTPAPRSAAAPAPATLLKPVGSNVSPPPLTDQHAEPNGRTDSRRPMESMLPVVAPTALTGRKHRIVDGDTLAGLAERYLGSSSRAAEILAANRDVLYDPKLLPIGVELKIPPR